MCRRNITHSHAALTSHAVSTNCDVAANGNAGCGVQSSTPNSYGKSFNAAGGGFYAMERTSTFIKVWFWSRNDPAVPADVKTAGATVNTDAFVSLRSSTCSVCRRSPERSCSIRYGAVQLRHRE